MWWRRWMRAPSRTRLRVPDSAVLRDSENQPFVYAEATAQSVWQAPDHGRGKLERRNPDHQRPEARRPRDRQTAACSCSLRIRCSGRAEPQIAWRGLTEFMTRTSAPHLNDPSHRTSRASSALSGADADRLHYRRRHHFLPAHAGGCLSRSFASASRTHHAMARPRGRRSRAPGHASARAGDERRAPHGGHALHLALRALRRHPDVRRRHRRLFRAADRFRAHAQTPASGRRDAGHGAAVQPQRPGLPLRAGKPRPHSAGTEDHRRLGGGAGLPFGARRGG